MLLLIDFRWINRTAGEIEHRRFVRADEFADRLDASHPDSPLRKPDFQPLGPLRTDIDFEPPFDIVLPPPRGETKGSNPASSSHLQRGQLYRARPFVFPRPA